MGASSGPGTPVAVRQPSPSRWRLVTDTARPSVLRLHLTAVPGMRATLDGRPLALRPYDHMMLEARVPAGRHVVVVWYWPSLFTAGLVLAGLSAVSLLAAVVAITVRRRRAASRAPHEALVAGSPEDGAGAGAPSGTPAPDAVPTGVGTAEVVAPPVGKISDVPAGRES